MSENITPSTELDLDAWLATGERTTHSVNLYARMDLIAEIDRLEAQRVEVEEVPEGEESLAGVHNPNAELDARINDLYRIIDQSKRVFRVTALTDEEAEEIRKEVLTDLSTDIDEAARFGREEALKSAKRMGVTDPKDRNAMARVGAKDFTDKLISREVALRMIAKSSAMQHGETYIPLSVEQARTLYEKLGEAQTGQLANAARKAKDEAPQVNVPK